MEGVEPTLGDELAVLGDDDVVEMTNLQEDDTGIPGVIFISTAMGSHGPRVKYFVEGRAQSAEFFRLDLRSSRESWPTAFRSAI